MNNTSNFLGICFSKQCKENKQKQKEAELAFERERANALAALNESINAKDDGSNMNILYVGIGLGAVIFIAALILNK
jgi:hypoxanthine-guanine phosphoribosyltransferase